MTKSFYWCHDHNKLDFIDLRFYKMSQNILGMCDFDVFPLIIIMNGNSLCNTNEISRAKRQYIFWVGVTTNFPWWQPPSPSRNLTAYHTPIFWACFTFTVSCLYSHWGELYCTPYQKLTCFVHVKIINTYLKNNNMHLKVNCPRDSTMALTLLVDQVVLKDQKSQSIVLINDSRTAWRT